MRRKLVAGNWKMHGRRAINEALIKGMRASDSFGEVDVWIAPPAIYVGQAVSLVAGSAIGVAGQNAASFEDGAFTGEVSAAMLADAGCCAVLVGHSERRSLFGETNEVVAEKFGLIKSAGLTPVLCVGETLAERESGLTEKVVLGQLLAVLNRFGVAALRSAVVAYEPVWAIGTGLTAEPVQAQQVHEVIRAEVSRRDSLVANELRILYGGSVKAASAPALFAMPDIDGALVGGASLKVDEFVAIIRLAGEGGRGEG